MAHNIIYSWPKTIDVVQPSPEYCPSVSWPTVHTNVICESSGGVLIAVHVLMLHTIYLCNNTAVNYN